MSPFYLFRLALVLENGPTKERNAAKGFAALQKDVNVNVSIECCFSHGRDQVGRSLVISAGGVAKTPPCRRFLSVGNEVQARI